MICPYCSAFTPDESRFCCRCASQIQTVPKATGENTFYNNDALFLLESSDASSAVDLYKDFEPGISALKRKKGRLWPPLLILCILFSLGLTLFILIRSDSVSDPSMPWFIVQNGTLYFDKTLYTGGSELIVPTKVGSQNVSVISADCFSGCNELTAVHLPEGIRRIEDRAFADCLSLRGIKLPETLQRIGSEAFSGCQGLEAMCVPYSVTQIGTGVLDACDQLSYIFYPGPAKDFLALNLAPLPAGTDVYCIDGVLSGE